LMDRRETTVRCDDDTLAARAEARLPALNATSARGPQNEAFAGRGRRDLRDIRLRLRARRDRPLEKAGVAQGVERAGLGMESHRSNGTDHHGRLDAWRVGAPDPRA